MGKGGAHLGKRPGDIQRKRRVVPELRRKHGRPESKKELVGRLAAEREERNKERDLLKKTAERRPDEFHFGYYSMNSKMQQKIEMTEDELKKMMRYIDGEVCRYEKKRMCGISRGRVNKHVKYDEDGEAVAGNPCEAVAGDTEEEASSAEQPEGCETRAEPALRAVSSSGEEEIGSEDASGKCGEDHSDGMETASTEDRSESDSNDYDTYIEQLLEKRKEAASKLRALKAKKGSNTR